MKRLLFALALIMLSCHSNCQEKGKVLVYSNKHDFLVPHIENTLRNIVNANSKNQLFNRVTNLNLLLVNTEADKLLRANIYYNAPNISFENLTNKTKDSLYNIFINNNYFLLINENILQDKIEFQLTFYEIISGKDTQNFPIRNIIKPISQNNFFINPDDPDYLTKLNAGVKKLIPLSNSPAKFNYSLIGNLKKLPNNSIITSTNDTLLLNITDLFDEDTPPESIEFKLYYI